MMEDIYKELKDTLESIPSPFEDESTGAKLERKFSEHSDSDEEIEKEESKTEATNTKLEDIDVTYDNAGSNQME